MNMGRLWLAMPDAVRAIVVGAAVASAGTVPWALLVSANIRHGSALPWAVPVMAAYQWLYWRYFVRGWGWPASTAEARRRDARANRVPDEVWGAAVLAGMIGLVAVLLLQGVLSRLVTLPQQRDIDPSRYPLATVVLWVVMGAIVAGVVEESAFRGYLQRPIERRHGPVVAILITGTMFAFAHFLHPEVGLVLLPFYIGVAAVYGALAYFTDSIWPGLVLHAGGNMFAAVGLFAGGRSEWQLLAAPAPLIWETGPDAAFWGSLAAFAAASALAVWAYSGLASAVRTARAANGG
jgi:membrane protease YdiL (CAAX protease family)